MAERVFTYGILMRDAAFGATLPGWRLEFDRFGTVVPDADATVYGGLIETDDLRRYDAVEGYRPGDPAGGYYDRVRVTVCTDEAGDVEAWVYVMNPEWRRGENFGFEHVARTLREYDRLGHPVAARDALAAAADLTLTEMGYLEEALG